MPRTREFQNRKIESERRAKTLRGVWLSELQAIAIYRAEIAVLKRSQFGRLRSVTLHACERILLEELAHSAHLESITPSIQAYPSVNGGRRVSEWAGCLLGTVLSLLPSRLSWKIHAWAERQAAEIYRSASLELEAPGLLDASAQETRHAEIFDELLRRFRR